VPTCAVDPTLARNFEGIASIGLIRGAYHFGHPGTDAVAQAQFFVQHVRAAGGFTSSPTLPLMLDLGAQCVCVCVCVCVNERERKSQLLYELYGYTLWLA
jgi:GH25 family lysozyme M1 (1,4-beta-N-acetylmuramidase)